MQVEFESDGAEKRKRGKDLGDVRNAFVAAELELDEEKRGAKTCRENNQECKKQAEEDNNAPSTVGRVGKSENQDD
jgi:hypothetical protein